MRICLVACLLVAAALPGLCYGATFPDQPFVVGTAYKPGEDTVAYIEKHFAADNGLVEVRYFNAIGESIANKQLDFSQSEFAPNMKVDDYRLERNIVVRHASDSHDADRCEVLITDVAKGHAAERYAAKQHSVMDAGFHYYIQHHWDSIIDSRNKQFRILLPAKKMALKMQVEPRDCEQAGASDHMQCFRISPRSWLLARLVKPIDLKYARDGKRLLRFQGLGQLPDEHGKGLVVDLRYEYPPQ